MKKHIGYFKHIVIAIVATVLVLVALLIIIVVGGLLMDERSDVEDRTALDTQEIGGVIG